MPVPKATENTITTFLKEELEKLGVTAVPFISIDIPSEKGKERREVDIYCENSGVYLCEAKFTESEILEAIEKCYNDYLKHHKILGISGCFSLLYPDELSKPMPPKYLKELIPKKKFKLIEMFPFEDKRKSFHGKEGTLREIAERIAHHVLTAPERVEPSIDWIIKTLREAAQSITIGLRHIAGERFEDLFGGKWVFENILQYEKGEYPVEDLRLAAAYLLVNQILFYHVICSSNTIRDRYGLSPIDEDKLTEPAQLNWYFKRILDVNYKAIFAYEVASKIPQGYVNEVRRVICVVKALSPEKVGGDLLGTIFHDLVPFEVRKSVAAFYTNPLAAELLASLAIEKPEVKVADLSVGSGGLLVAAYRRKKELLSRFTGEDHRRFVEEELLGVDVMPFAASLAACHLALQAPEYFTDKVNIAVWDSTALKPGMKIPSVASVRYVVSGQTDLSLFEKSHEQNVGVVSLTEQGHEIQLQKFDVVIMNPPFTRQEKIKSDISEEYKKLLQERFDDYKEYLHGQLGYYGYFVLLADKFLDEGGRMALVLPAAFLRVRSAKGIRRFLAENYTIEYVIFGKLNFSDATWRREILFVARKGRSRKECIAARLARLPNSRDEAREFAERIRGGESESNEILTYKIKQDDFKQQVDWLKLFPTESLDIIERTIEEIAKRIPLIRLGDLLRSLESRLREGIESRRGVSLHDVVILREEERARRKKDRFVIVRKGKTFIKVKDRTLGKITTVQRSRTAPALRSLSSLHAMKLEEKVLDYLITDVSQEWAKYVKDRMGNLIIHRRPVLPAPGTIHLCYYSETPVAPPGTSWITRLDNESAKIMCLWLNSSLGIAQYLLRRVEDVWADMHKYILETLLVPDLRSLKREQKKQLLSLFKEVASESFPPLIKQFEGAEDALSAQPNELKRRSVRAYLDVRLLEIMGLDEKEIKDVLKDLYNAMSEEFAMLKELMENEMEVKKVEKA